MYAYFVIVLSCLRFKFGKSIVVFIEGFKSILLFVCCSVGYYCVSHNILYVLVTANPFVDKFKYYGFCLFLLQEMKSSGAFLKSRAP